jgi:hypothetical protein
LVPLRKERDTESGMNANSLDVFALIFVNNGQVVENCGPSGWLAAGQLLFFGQHTCLTDPQAFATYVAATGARGEIIVAGGRNPAQKRTSQPVRSRATACWPRAVN